ncbi:hypothetical protein GOP47_0003365 [Adiantum capillus-veneris]|uniref:Uncharacterized protein n=1 Tax=Adiantum capillus-veneris TaxID=13818 RepID=A0A9D4VDU8_ADICA|nr:hypothetical protein GOP47_0003365 [Adiantum capillus-veneris]
MEESFQRLQSDQSNAVKPPASAVSKSAPETQRLGSSAYIAHKHTLDALQNATAAVAAATAAFSALPQPVGGPIDVQARPADKQPLNLSYACSYDDQSILATAAAANLEIPQPAPDAPYILRYSPPPSPPDDCPLYNSSNLQSSAKPSNLQDRINQPLVNQHMNANQQLHSTYNHDYVFGSDPISAATASQYRDEHNWVKDYNAAAYLSSMYDDSSCLNPMSAPKVDAQHDDHWVNDRNFLDRLPACNPPGYEWPLSDDWSFLDPLPAWNPPDYLLTQQVGVSGSGNRERATPSSTLAQRAGIDSVHDRAAVSTAPLGLISDRAEVSATGMPLPKPIVSAAPAPAPPKVALPQRVGLSGNSSDSAAVSATPLPTVSHTPSVPTPLLTEQRPVPNLRDVFNERQGTKRKQFSASSLPVNRPHLAAPPDFHPNVAKSPPTERSRDVHEGPPSTSAPVPAVAHPHVAAPPNSQPNKKPSPPSEISPEVGAYHVGLSVNISSHPAPVSATPLPTVSSMPLPTPLPTEQRPLPNLRDVLNERQGNKRKKFSASTFELQEGPPSTSAPVRAVAHPQVAAPPNSQPNKKPSPPSEISPEVGASHMGLSANSCSDPAPTVSPMQSPTPLPTEQRPIPNLRDVFNERQGNRRKKFSASTVQEAPQVAPSPVPDPQPVGRKPPLPPQRRSERNLRK